MSVIDTAKKHPYLLGGVAIAAFLVIMIATKRSNAGAVEMPATPTGSVENGTAAQVAAQQAQAQANAIQGQLQDDAQKISGQISLADLQGKYSYQVAQLQADIAAKQIDVSANNSTLAAQLKAKELDYQRDLTLGNFNHQEQMQLINNDLIKSIFNQQYQAQQLNDARTQVAHDEYIIGLNTPAWKAAFAAQGYTQPGLDYAGDLARLNALRGGSYTAISPTLPPAGGSNTSFARAA